jgi:Fur family ferric uptake transcriptional regulator
MTYNTEKRCEIIKLLKNNRGTFTVEEICDRILVAGRGKSTVYRLLSKLCEEGVTRRITDPDMRKTAYQYVGDAHCAHHLHLKCKECGALIHLDADTTGTLLKTVMDVKGFAIELGGFIYGVCEGCTRQEGGAI